MKKWLALGMMFTVLQSAFAVTPPTTDTPEALLLKMSLCMGPDDYDDADAQLYQDAFDKLFDMSNRGVARGEIRLLGAKVIRRSSALGEIPGYYVRLEGNPEDILLNLHRAQGITLKLNPKSDGPACQPEQQRCTRIWSAPPAPGSTRHKESPTIVLSQSRFEQKNIIMFGCGLTTRSMLP